MRIASLALAAGVTGVATLALAASSPSPLGPPPAPGTGLAAGQCLYSRDIGNHTVVDRNTLLVDAIGRSRGLYRFTMKNGCLLSAVSSDPIAIEHIRRDRICGPRDLTVIARSGLCDIASIDRLSPQEAEALPRALKP